ncbi:MAG: recombinase family protein [Erysipelotrichaceae bacterium]|nr:recombinase family protein [Erysipelotrichaceae bacterium]
MRGVIYARYSSDNQREESIEGQLRDCRSFAYSRGIEIIDTYVDRALSARSDDRPSFQKMINDSYSNAFEAVIVWKSDRFSRNRRQAMDYRDILKRNKVAFLSATEVNLDGPENILIEGMRDSYNEYYSAELAVKIKRGEKDNVINGKFNGGRVAFGYILKDGKLLVDEEKAEVVREIFYQYATTDFSCNELKIMLENKGVRKRDGKPLSHGTISNILKNRLYLGEYTWGGTTNKNCYPALIDEKTYEIVQDKLERNANHNQIYRSGDNKGYILTDKLFCGVCGSKMVGESSNSRNKTYQYYKCKRAKKKLCKMKVIPKKWIEDFVVDSTMVWLRDQFEFDDLVDSVYEHELKGNPMIKEIEMNVVSVQKRMANIMQAIENGMDSNDFKARYDELKNDKLRLERSLEEEKMKNPVLSKDQIKWFLNQFRSMEIKTPRDKKRIVDYFVNSVVIDEDTKSAVITYNFRTRTNRMHQEEIVASSELIAPPNQMTVELQ